MRLTGVEIKNFLCFRHLFMPIANPMQLVAGANNSGKSSLLRLLDAFFAGAEKDEWAELRPRNKYYTDGAGSRTMSVIKLTFEPTTEAEKSAFADVTTRGHFWVSISRGRGDSFAYAASRKASAGRAREVYDAVLGKFHFVLVPSVRIGDTDANHPAAFDRLFRTLEGVLVRKGKARHTSLQSQFREKTDPIRELLQTTLDQAAVAIKDALPVQGGVIQFDLGGPADLLSGLMASVRVSSNDGQTKMPLEKRGTGYQSVLVLGVLQHVAAKEAARGTNVIFAIEEPEAFLHPQLQRSVAASLRSLADDAQLIVTTHSPVLVDANPIGVVVRLPLMPEGTVFAWKPEALDGSRAGRLSRVCNASNSELIFASRAIVVEGESDKLFIEYILDSELGQDVGHMHGISVIDAGGVEVVAEVLKLARIFGVPAMAVVDRDSLDKPGNHRPLVRIVEEGFGIELDPRYRQGLAEHARAKAEDHDEARGLQRVLLQELHDDPVADVFVLTSDLEGLLGSAIPPKELAEALGPDGCGHWPTQLVDLLTVEDQGSRRVMKKLGSKGFNRDIPQNGGRSYKLKPHMIVPILEAGHDSFFENREAKLLTRFVMNRRRRRTRPGA